MSDFAARIANAKTFTEIQEIVGKSVSDRDLMLFMRLDAGSAIAKAGGKPNSVRLVVGNPVIIQSMARLVPDAASYAPVTILIDQRSEACTSAMTKWQASLEPYGDTQALAIARELDTKVKRLLQEAA